MQEITKKDLELSYASKDTAELISLSKLDLAPLAREILELEIRKRYQSGFQPEQLSESAGSDSGTHDRLAAISSRAYARIIDFLIAASFLSLAGISQLGQEIGLLLCVLYLLFADGLFNGQSIGKLVTNIVVIVEQTGRPCGFWHSLLRNTLCLLLTVVDWAFIFGLKRQRLGDKLAGTQVIKATARI